MAIGRGDLPCDELRRSHERLERADEVDVRWRAHELTKRCLVLPDREGPVVAGEGLGPERVAD